MKYTILAVMGLCFLTTGVSAQVNSSSFSQSLAEKFSQTRVLDVRYGYYSGRSFSGDAQNTDLANPNDDGHIDSNQDFRLNVNLPVYQQENLRVTYSGFYNYQGYKYDNLEVENRNKDLHYFSSTLSLNYFTELFDKPLILGGNMVLDASDEMLGRIKGYVSASWVLKAEKKNNMSVGLIGIIDKTNPVPLVPTFSYTTMVFNENWRLDMVLPIKIALQNQISSNSRISIGSEFENTEFYFNSNGIKSSVDHFQFRQSALKSGITYEYLLAKKFVLTAKAGVMNVIRSRVTEKGESFDDDDYILKYNPDASAYFNVGVSFNPF